MQKLSGRWFGGIVAGFLVFFESTFVASAATTLSLVNPLSGLSGGATVNNIVAKIGAFMLALAMPICGIMVIIGGFQMMTAAGDPAKFSNGRKTLVYAAVGFVIVLFASSVVPLLKSILGG